MANPVDAELLQLSVRIESRLVAKNLRGMQTVRAALEPGYCLRAAQLLNAATGNLLIATGFPVTNTFETDGPAGAIALYRSLNTPNKSPIVLGNQQISDALAEIARTVCLLPNSPDSDIDALLRQLQPAVIISIETPDRSADGNFYNMHGKDISPACIPVDRLIQHADCPTIGIGDGGNEVGMGKAGGALKHLNIRAATTTCDELIVADVSNWAAYGLIALLSVLRGTDLLAGWNNPDILQYLLEHGAVDGVTMAGTATEDGLPSEETEGLIHDLRRICGFVA